MVATVKPDLTRVWANGAPGANVVDPDVTTPGKFDAGWLAEVPPFEHFNFLQKLFTQGLAHNNEQGINIWDTDTTYPIGALVKGSDNGIYRAIVEQNGNDPISDGGVNWINTDITNKLAPFSTISTLKTFTGFTTDNIGHFVEVIEHSAGLPIGNKYIIQATTGGTDDNGSLIKSTGSTSVEFVNFFIHDIRDVDFGASPGLSDNTSIIQTALNYVYTQNKGSLKGVDGIKNILGTLIIPAGVSYFGNTSSNEYFPGEAALASNGLSLVKPLVGSTNGPIIEMTTASSIRQMYLKHLKTNGATTGIVQMGAVGTTVTCYNAKVTDIRMYGDFTADITGTNTCYGIYFPPSDTGTAKQRYFNKVENTFITNCDVGIRLNENSNANLFTSIITRQCLYHYELDGGVTNTNCVDNVFTGLVLQNIGALTGDGFGFVLRNGSSFNTFTGYSTEMNEAAFNIGEDCILNKFIGRENEGGAASFVPPAGISGEATGNSHSRFQPPINNAQYTQMLLPVIATTNKYDQVGGGKISMYQLVDGTANGLPALDGAGALVAATAHSRSIVQFKSEAYSKSVQPNFRCKMTIFLTAPGTSGQAMATVEFMYVVTNTSTNAAVLRVISSQLAPAAANFISGLKFITGVSGSTEFRIAVVGGNVSPSLATRLAVSLDIDHYKLSQTAKENYTNLGFISTAATANDVTDAIDLLTVADTII